MIQVELTVDEAMAAGTVGLLQMLRKIRHARNGDHGGISKRKVRERWGDTINGMMGEVAACKALSRAWSPGGQVVSFGECVGYEVRTAFDPGDGLLIYPSDPDERLFVFVRGSFPTFEVYPPIAAGACKKLGEWKDGFDPPCWRVAPRSITDTVKAFQHTLPLEGTGNGAGGTSAGPGR